MFRDRGENAQNFPFILLCEGAEHSLFFYFSFSFSACGQREVRNDDADEG